MNAPNLYESSKIAERIKSQVKQKKLSLKELLSECELGVNTISKIASGKDIYSKNLAKIADKLDCSVDYLLGRTDVVELNTDILKDSELRITHKKPNSTSQNIIKPLFLTPASAGTGSLLDGDTPAEWVTVPKTDETISADFLIEVRGDSMIPKYYDGDTVLIKKSNSIREGDIGLFILNNEAYIKKMGKGKLISLNPDYDDIAVSEYDTISCAGKVIGVLEDE